MAILTAELGGDGLLCSVDPLLLLERVFDDGGEVVLKRGGTTSLNGQLRSVGGKREKDLR